MALTSLERANLKRLQACVAPNERKINSIKERLRKAAEKAQAEIKALQEANESYTVLINDLLAKEAAPEEEEEVTVDLEPVPSGKYDPVLRGAPDLAMGDSPTPFLDDTSEEENFVAGIAETQSEDDVWNV